MSYQRKQTINNLTELDTLARDFAAALKAGDVVALNGPMGAGKTTFIQSLGKHLGIDEKIVSPTFVLMNDYLSGPTPMIHIDLYRLGPEGSGSIADEVLSAIREQKALVVVEWAEYGDFLTPHLSYRLTIAVDPATESRQIEIEPLV